MGVWGRLRGIPEISLSWPEPHITQGLGLQDLLLYKDGPSPSLSTASLAP